MPRKKGKKINKYLNKPEIIDSSMGGQNESML
jgi:hypothetical protein